jgi:hypothetical protein
MLRAAPTTPAGVELTQGIIQGGTSVMKKDSLPDLGQHVSGAHLVPLFGDRYEYQNEHFMDVANDLLRNDIYPLFHNQAREFVHEGRACALRHLVDNHLASMETDPIGLKLLVAPKGMDRHTFETKINNRDFVHPQYFAVIASPVSRTIKLEYYKGDMTGETVHYYEKQPLDFEVNRVKLGFLKFTELLP